MRILAVDDDPIVLELIEQFMEVLGGHELATAGSASAALTRLDAGEVFDCFLLDIQMSKMDGIDLTRHIRERTDNADTPVLMLTSMSDKRYIDWAFAAGATDYVTKPFEITELRSRLAMVNSLLAKRQPRPWHTLTGCETGTGTPIESIALHEPISVSDVDNVIEHMAMENYVAQLTRAELPGSVCFALSILKIEDFHARMSAFEFYRLISDVAEVISDTLKQHHFLMSYAGYGTFVCVSESRWRSQLAELADAINLSLARTELYDNTGARLNPQVCAGKAIPLTAMSDGAFMDALADANSACAHYGRAQADSHMRCTA